MIDFFGNAIGKKLLGKGLEMAFGTGGDSAVQPIQYNIPSFAGLSMQTYTASTAQQPKEIEVSNYEVIKASWDRRLFGENSYTNIVLPRID